MKCIVFVGYNYSTENILPAERMGYKTVLIGPQKDDAPFDEMFKTDLKNPKTILANLKKIKRKYEICGVITRMEKFTPQQAFISRFFKIPATEEETAVGSRHKYALREILKDSEFNIRSELVETEEEAVRAAKKLKYPVIIKNTVGAKSLFIKKVENEKELRKNFREIKEGIKKQSAEYTVNFRKFFPKIKYRDPKKHLLIEKFISGKQITVVSFPGDKKIWHIPILCRVVTAKESGIQDTHLLARTIPYKAGKVLTKKIFQASEDTIKRLKTKRCGTHIELLVTEKNEVKILEITTRLGGFRPEMFKEAYGMNLFRILTEVAVGKTPKIKLKQKCAVTAVEKFHSKSGTIKSITGIKKIQARKDIFGFKQAQFIGDETGPASKGHRAICSFMVKGKTSKTSYEKALKYLKEIRIIVK